MTGNSYGTSSYGGTVDSDGDIPEDGNEDDDSPMADAPEIGGEINREELAAFIDSRIEEQTSNISNSDIEETVRNVIAERDEGQIDYEILAGKIIEKIGEDSSGSTE